MVFHQEAKEQVGPCCSCTNVDGETQQRQDKNQGVAWDRYGPQAGESWRNRDFITLAVCRVGGKEGRETSGSGQWAWAQSPAAGGAGGEGRGKMSPSPHLPHLFERAADDTTVRTFICDFITGFHGKYCVTREFINSRQEEAEEPEKQCNRAGERPLRGSARPFTRAVYMPTVLVRSYPCVSARLPRTNRVSSRPQ